MNLEKLNVVELNAQEVEEVQGGGISVLLFLLLLLQVHGFHKRICLTELMLI
jgi:hypothetical protein